MSARKVANKSKSIRKPKNKGFTVYTAESSSTSDDNQLNLNPNGVSATSTGTALSISEEPSVLQVNVPSARCSVSGDRPKLTGKRDDYSCWEIRAKAHFASLNLEATLESENPDAQKNKLLYLELITLVDNESLQLIASNAPNDGKKAFELLRQFYLGNDNARMVNAVQQLSLLEMKPGETIQQFICRCDTLRNTLKSFKMTENYDIILVLNARKALPDTYKIFKGLIVGAPVLPDWENFKLQLFNHVSLENIEKSAPQTNSVMNVQVQNQPQILNSKPNTHYKKFVNRKFKNNKYRNYDNYQYQQYPKNYNYNYKNSRGNFNGRGRGNYANASNFNGRGRQNYANNGNFNGKGRENYTNTGKSKYNQKRNTFRKPQQNGYENQYA